MKNISTGFGLCVAAAAALAYPFVSNFASTANASAVTAAASAVSTAATAQTGPTIVWYQAIGLPPKMALYRAWSDGRVELRTVERQDSAYNGSSYSVWCDPSYSPCVTPWTVVSDQAQGLTYRSDINFDEQVNGADLGQLLADWGNAPRQDIPPSDCPLALINP
jgi:hypothetical protein